MELFTVLYTGAEGTTSFCGVYQSREEAREAIFRIALDYEIIDSDNQIIELGDEFNCQVYVEGEEYLPSFRIYRSALGERTFGS